MSVYELKTISDFKDFISRDTLTLVEFYDERSLQSRTFRILDELERYVATVEVGLVNVDTNPMTRMISAEYQIKNFPTFIFHKNRKIVDKVEGPNLRMLVNVIEKHGQIRQKFKA